MATQTPLPSTTDPALAASQLVLEDLFAPVHPRQFDVRFWDGSVWRGETETPIFTLVLKHPGAVRRMFWPPRPHAFAEAYVYGDLDIEGDIAALSEACPRAIITSGWSLRKKLRLAWRLWRLPHTDRPGQGKQPAQLNGQMHSRQRDLDAIRYHYDLPDTFFESILDPLMQYTTAVFESPDDSLAAAQERKLDLICRKLRLKAGDRVLDIGCGWGGLATFAAKNYGARVVGATISKAQATWARDRVRRAGLEDRCRIELTDYRDLPETEPFDHVTTIEVSEHFGAGQMPTYFGKVWRLLRPGGRVLHQQITLTGHQPMPDDIHAFMQRFVFPDAEIMPVSVPLRAAEQSGFEVRDVESFREHYPLTLKRWLANAEAKEHELIAATDEPTYRIFRMYLAGAVHGFEKNIINLHQILLVKPTEGRSGLPLARTDWYG